MEGLPSIKRHPVPDHPRHRIEIRNRGRHALRDGSMARASTILTTLLAGCGAVQ
jgi:hypothetical protein